jgi:hypothetical protein
MKRYLLLFGLFFFPLISLKAASVADYKSQMEALKNEIEPERKAKPLFNLPSFLGSLQEYFRELSVDENNLTFRDYKRMREGYKKAYQLVLEIASDNELSEKQKFEALEYVSNTLGESIEKLTKPYVDAEMPPEISRGHDENPFAYAGRWIWTKFLYAVSFTSRDVTTWVNPTDGRGNWSVDNFSRNAVEGWGNIKRSRFLKQTSKDFGKIYTAELKKAKNDKAYNARMAALINLVQKYYEQEIEPMKYGKAHRAVGLFYLFMAYGYWYFFPYHDVVADLPPFYGERTKLTGIMSVALGAAAWTVLYATRQGNSGLGFYRSLSKLMRTNEKVLKSLPMKPDERELCEKLLMTSAEP